MSLATSTTTRCKYCGEDYTENYKRGYCSEECYHKRQGEKLLNTVKHDHTFCYNCGTRLKEIEKPPENLDLDESGVGWTINRDENRTELEKYSQEETRRALVGYQYGTDQADSGHKTSQYHNGIEVVREGLTCETCGNTKQNTHFPESRDRFLLEYTSYLLDALREKQDEHETEFCEETVFQKLIETGDLKLSLGIAVES